MNRAGACLCGAVAFPAAGRARTAHESHCRQCRVWSGHVWAYVEMRWSAITLTRSDTLRWYRHRPRALRGFCAERGSTLFFRPEGKDRVDVSPGALDAPTGLRLGKESYARFKGDHDDLDWLR